MHNWVNTNKELLHTYKGKWIAYTEDGIIASENDLAVLTTSADRISNKYIVFFVHPDMFGIRFRPIHFRSVFFHEWTPLYSVQLQSKTHSLELPMLIDSGADGSLLSFQTGTVLGFQVADNEIIHEAKGIGGGTIKYVWRNIQVTLAEHSMEAPFAWILEGENQENIIGRQVIFDKFDIEFKQADEMIIFKYRDDQPAARIA